MIKVLGAWWYNGTIGIVKVFNGFEVKYYIGTGYGQDEKEDIDKILKHGSRFYPEVFEVGEWEYLVYKMKNLKKCRWV